MILTSGCTDSMIESSVYGESVVATLQRILLSVTDQRDQRFSGVGVVVSDHPASIPHCRLVEGWPVVESSSVAESLLDLADQRSLYHDGFHIMSSAFQLTRVGCYVAPRIPDDLSEGCLHQGGCRHATGLLLSLYPDVICCGVVSVTGASTLFVNGRSRSLRVSNARKVPGTALLSRSRNSLVPS